MFKDLVIEQVNLAKLNFNKKHHFQIDLYKNLIIDYNLLLQQIASMVSSHPFSKNKALLMMKFQQILNTNLHLD